MGNLYSDIILPVTSNFFHDVAIEDEDVTTFKPAMLLESMATFICAFPKRKDKVEDGEIKLTMGDVIMVHCWTYR